MKNHKFTPMKPIKFIAMMILRIALLPVLFASMFVFPLVFIIAMVTVGFERSEIIIDLFFSDSKLFDLYA